MMLSRRLLLGSLAAAAYGPLSGCAHPDTSALGPYVAGYYYAFPIFEFARTHWNAAAPNPQRPAHRYNMVLHRRTLTDHTGRNVTTPNNDTVYSSARLDLTNGPVLAEFPTLHDRYFSISFMNAFTDNFAYIGTRSSNGNGGRALIVGPAWQGETPANARLIRSQTDDVWMLTRIVVDGPDDLAAANAAQDQVRIVEAPEPTLLPVAPRAEPDLGNMLGVVNAVLARSSCADPVGRRADGFARIGIRAGELDAWGALSPQQQQLWRDGAAQAGSILRQGFLLGGETVSGWTYPPPGVGSSRASDEVRAAVALSGLAALEADEATYARADIDQMGEALTGARAYTLTIPADVPARAFWSLSMYQLEPDGRLFFTENPIARYSIGDRTPGLLRNNDGSAAVLMQHGRPDDTSANWLPTPPGPFVITFRVYLPERAMTSGSWRLPPIRRLD